MRKTTPVVVPTKPFALSRASSGMRIETRVGRAMPRMLPAITP